jgi:hypothetical protein
MLITDINMNTNPPEDLPSVYITRANPKTLAIPVANIPQTVVETNKQLPALETPAAAVPDPAAAPPVALPAIPDAPDIMEPVALAIPEDIDMELPVIVAAISY